MSEAEARVARMRMRLHEAAQCNHGCPDAGAPVCNKFNTQLWSFQEP